MTPEERLTRSEQRDAAREKARQLRESNKRKEKARKLTLKLSLGAGLLAIVVGVAWVFIAGSSQENNGDNPLTGTPANMIFDNGIKIGAGLQPFTKTSTPTPTAQPTPGTVVPNIVMYIDYQCPVCGAFEQANSAQIRSWAESGAATVEVHPISFLDGASTNKYSSRAANAALCVANYAPEKFWDFSAALFTNQPAEQTAGPDNAALYQTATSVGVPVKKSIENCINNNSFASWMKDSTTQALTDTIPGTNAKLKGTPTVIVNGQIYAWNTGEELISAARFAQFVQQSAGN